MPNIFISYRRDDSAYPAHSIYEKLVSCFGEESIFFDVDSIPIGVDFCGILNSAVAQCDILLAIIGDQWLKAQNDAGQRRLDDPSDFVRIEIEAALSRNIPVVPVLVGTAAMPLAQDLPETLRPLVRRNAAEVRPGRGFRGHLDRLVRGVEQGIESSKQHSGTATSITPDAESVKDRLMQILDGVTETDRRRSRILRFLKRVGEPKSYREIKTDCVSPPDREMDNKLLVDLGLLRDSGLITANSDDPGRYELTDDADDCLGSTDSIDESETPAEHTGKHPLFQEAAIHEDFDPSLKRQGIPRDDQTPNYYRLLGIDLFEDDRDVIDRAANRVMQYLTQLLTGDHAAHAQNILNEVARARLCLLTPEEKTAYDADLWSKMSAAAGLVVELDCPRDMSDTDIIRHVRELALRADAYHRSLGGSGLRIDSLEATEQLGVPAGVPHG